MFKNLSFKTLLSGGYFIILCLLVLITVTLYIEINSLIESSKLVTHSNNVIMHIKALEKLMVDMETGQRGFMLTGNDNFLAPYLEGQKEFEKNITEVKKLVADNPTQIENFSRVNELKDQWLKDAGQYEIDLKKKVDKGEISPVALKNVLEGKKIDGTAQSSNYKSGKDIMDLIRIKLDQSEDIENTLLEKRAHSNSKSAMFAKNTVLYGTILAIIISIALIFFMIKLLFGQLGAEPKDLQNISNKVANGDLRVEFNENMLSTKGTLAQSFKEMITNLKNLILNINTNSKSTAEKSNELSKSLSDVKDLTDNMNQQSNIIAAASEQASSNMNSIASSIEEINSSINSTATAIEEMSATITEISKNCQKESTIAGEANSKAISTNEQMKKLEISANQVGKILDLIKDIADQTNLLALNATIEAASAGEAGKGFAVVAVEVKQLAKQTNQAIDEITAQIETMKSNTSESVKAIAEITEKIEAVNLISQTIVSAIDEQVATISEISHNISSVSEATNNATSNVQESAKGISEITSNISGFNKSTTEISLKMEQGQKRTLELSDVAAKLKGSVDAFDL